MTAASASLSGSLRDIWAGVWKHARGRREALAGAMLLLVGAELLRLPMPWLAGEAVNVLQREGTAGAAEAGRWLAWLFATVVVAWLCHAAGRVLERNVALHARRSLSLDVMRRMLRAPLRWHRQEHPLARAQRAMQATGALTEFTQSQYVYLQTAVRILGPVIALMLISPLTGAAACVGIALLGAVSLRFDDVLLRLTDRMNAAERRNGATWGELLGNVVTLLALRLEACALALAKSRLSAVLQPLRRLVVVNELKWGAVDILGHLLWCSLVVLYVAQADAGSAIALGGVFMVYEYARSAESSMGAVAANFSMLAGQLSGWRALEPVLAAPDATDAPVLAPTPWNRLELHRVAVAFEASEQPVLNGVQLVLQRGRRYAVTGGSGSGKSALLALLAGLEPASDGVVACDGQRVDAAWLRREATLVPAQPVVFEGTVRENLFVGPGEDESAKRALEVAGLRKHVETQPLGLDSMVGDGLARWSSGQQQRLSLARGTLATAGASLVLLDEPTSHLDKPTAHAVLKGLLEANAGACIVVALHDPELACHFDELIVLADGRVESTVPA